ncbi:MAG: excisionase family DNA-binding protein [Liquorilactobacillus ghanensis]|uniref:excisionase family DNA-binding protein n=1 Tax=Liquorilactobacillus ghanensis TaxID=399370 RepID=UPI0039EB37A5
MRNQNYEKLDLKLDKFELLSIPQVAKLLNVKRETIEIWLQDPGVPRLFVGRSKQVRLPKKQFLDYLANRAKDWPQYQ